MKNNVALHKSNIDLFGKPTVAALFNIGYSVLLLPENLFRVHLCPHDLYAFVFITIKSLSVHSTIVF